MTLPLLNTRGNVNQDLYARALSSVYWAGIRISDPDYALAQEPDPYEKARKDPVVGQAIDIRLHGVAGRKFKIVAGGDSEADKALADLVDDGLSHIDGFPEARYESAQAVIRARSFQYIEGERRFMTLGGGPIRDYWIPTKLKDIDRRRFRWIPVRFTDEDGRIRVRTRMQIFSWQRRVWENVIHHEYFVRIIYNDEEARLGYGRGLLEAIYYYLWAKQVVLREGLQGIEKWARGIWTAEIDGLRDASTGKPNTVVQKAWNDALREMQSRGVLTYDSRDTFKVHETSGTGHNIVMEMLHYLDDGIRSVILGSVLPFGGGEKDATLAGTMEQSDVHQILIAFDREKLDEAYTRDLIGLFLKLNRSHLFALGLGNAKSPKFETEVERKVDRKREADINEIALRSGMPLIEEEAYESIGRTAPREGDKVIEPVTNTGEPVPGGGLFFARERPPISTYQADPFAPLVYKDPMTGVLTLEPVGEAVGVLGAIPQAA